MGKTTGQAISVLTAIECISWLRLCFAAMTNSSEISSLQQRSLSCSYYIFLGCGSTLSILIQNRADVLPKKGKKMADHVMVFFSFLLDTARVTFVPVALSKQIYGQD